MSGEEVVNPLPVLMKNALRFEHAGSEAESLSVFPSHRLSHGVPRITGRHLTPGHIRLRRTHIPRRLSISKRPSVPCPLPPREGRAQPFLAGTRQSVAASPRRDTRPLFSRGGISAWKNLFHGFSGLATRIQETCEKLFEIFTLIQMVSTKMAIYLSGSPEPEKTGRPWTSPELRARDEIKERYPHNLISSSVGVSDSTRD